MSDLETSAREAANEARLLYREHFFRGACSRAYYAMFNAARAMLASRGYQPEEIKTQKSVLRLFSLGFVKAGPFETEVGQALHRAAEARHVADYEGGVSEKEAGEVICGARSLHAVGGTNAVFSQEHSIRIDANGKEAWMSDFRLTGGCQCGAVRYALLAEPDNPHICHCRMCQKAFGSFFAPLTGVPLDKFRIMRGTLAVFKSSDLVERGFCRDCGTPLSFRFVDGDRISVSIGSLDEPARVEPKFQCGNEGRLPWFDKLPGLPGDTTTEEDSPEEAAKIAASNHQHPDHDTEVWPLPGRGGG